MNNTFTLGQQMESKGFEKDRLIYIASSWEQTSKAIIKKITQNIKNAGFKTVRRVSVLVNLDLPRDQQALVEYYIGLQAQKTIGNSVSSFTALMLLERQYSAQWASYYNGGDVPLEIMVPLFKLPWVFAYNSWSTKNDYMVKAAVISATLVGNFEMFCLFSGNENSDIHAWLQDHDVTIIVHNPTWMPDLVNLNDNAIKNLKHSHLYADPEGLIGTFQRIDIPILEELKQYNFVFYTDTDIFFLDGISLEDFPKPFPRSVGMGPEMLDVFPYNAGIALWNVQAMRDTYNEFQAWLLKQNNSLYFEGYGPLDQGALNKFYEDSVRDWKLPAIFNARAYQEFNPEAKILHFHGPKPDNYLEYVQNGTCKFDVMCRMGTESSLCQYVPEWYQYTLYDNPEGEEIAEKLVYACENTITSKSTKLRKYSK
eukprot:TRINITY_DN7827_c0_g1_i4.p1 TRINITY_DN7827_c0_g1~~TRINITY_DN7827_c0_g1_i4.p1  ORF type:complete len:425 (+),score=60.26 TRINITY_DN7827_c0_g1_i4:236-1510(+)